MSRTFAVSSPAQNQLWCSLPGEERDRLLSQLRRVSLSLGEVLFETHQRINCVYFVTSAIVSLVYATATGATAETAIVGSDGVVGLGILLGGHSACHRSVIAVAGEAFTLPAPHVIEAFERDPAVRRIFLRYTQGFITQISQTAVCNRLHSIEQRLCRWLLLCHDRTGSSELLMTQELIAHMLGGRRESVTVAAGHLQDLGLIQYCRGHIRILDRKRLEECACECYRTVEEELAQLYGAKRGPSFSPPPAALERAV